MNTSAAVLIGSAISAIVALAVVGFQHSLERRRQFNAERAERLGDFLASTFAVSTRIEQVATAPDDPGARPGVVESGVACPARRDRTADRQL
jgi:hypothetical protein